MAAVGTNMLAAVLDQPGSPLSLKRLPVPEPAPGQILLRVDACAVCRTDLHIVDGELTRPTLPLIPGHEIVGTVVAAGPDTDRFSPGQRVGVPWLGKTCGDCEFCRDGHENLCEQAQFTGYQLPGGYAEYTVAHADFCHAIPDVYAAVQAAPLLCAGLIGYRTLQFAGKARHIGLFGFGAAAHIVAQIARHEGRSIYAFTRPGDHAAQQFARELGAVWAGDSTAAPDTLLDAALIFAPAGELVPAALQRIKPGGRVVCGGIHMSDIPSFPYAWLWGERSIRSVANLTRADGEAFMRLAPSVPVRTSTTAYPLSEANRALADLREGRISGAAVLVP
jgi:alcohol dehydrogenase, propanol-preferring